MHKLRSYIAAGALALAAFAGALLPPAPANSQVYPTQNPTYTPNPLIAPVVIPTGQGSIFPFVANGTQTIYVRIFGAPSGLSAYLQGTTERVSGVGQAFAQTVTISNASPAVITAANHQLSVNQQVVFTTTGVLPAGLTAGTTYFVIAAGFTSGAYEVSATIGGAAINTTNAGSGTHTATANAPLWSNLAVDKVAGPAGVGGPRQTQITGNGLYRVNISGYSQVRLNVQALTSGVTYVDFAAGTGNTFITTAPNLRNTYSASASIATGGTNHFLAIPGNATSTVRITNVQCSAVATAGAYVQLTAELTAADTGDAGTAMTATPHDSNNAAAISIPVFHTTSPTPGASIGQLRSSIMTIVPVAQTATDFPAAQAINWDFGTRPWGQEIVLRGVAQVFALNTSAAFGAGGVARCSLEWSEELN